MLVNLSWEASTDNVDVETYLIFQKGIRLVSNTNTTTSKVVSSLQSHTAYTFKVQAKDTAGNRLGFSNEININTFPITAELQFASGDIEVYLRNFTDSVPENPSESYRISDLAHNTQSIFQKTTGNLFNNISNSVFVQLHSFGKKPSDPYIILSNGTRETPTTDYIVLLKDALLLEDSSLTFKIAYIDADQNRLIGFTNMQVRLNSENHCTSAAIATSSRFIHIEQECTKLRYNTTGWIKMNNALKSIFN
jgi:hypothetical protein